MKQHLKKHFSFADFIIVSVNLFAVWGVLFKEWSAIEVFLVYCLESVIVGCFTIFKMLLTSVIKKQDVWENKGAKKMMPGFFFILFFILHYGLFIVVQLSLFFGALNMRDLPNVPNSLQDFFLNVPKYLSGDAIWLLWSFIISYAFQTLKSFVFTGEYKTASLDF